MTTIIHICGFSGSGKTTLGNKLKDIYEDNIVLQELDEFLPDGDAGVSSKDIQKHMLQSVDNVIKQNVNKIIIFVGTTCNNATLEEFTYIGADYNIWLNVSIEDASTNAINRQINYMYNNKNDIIDMMKSMSYDETSDYLNSYCNYESRIQSWSPLYEICVLVYKYTPMTSEQIINLIKLII